MRSAVRPSMIAMIAAAAAAEPQLAALDGPIVKPTHDVSNALPTVTAHGMGDSCFKCAPVPHERYFFP